MSRYNGEKVLVVTRSLFDELGSFHGLSREVDRYLPVFLDGAHNFFLDREEAEDDPSHKQIIPYAIFHHDGKFLHYVRGKKSGEQRLASKGSIGIGGHINQSDFEAAHLGEKTYLNGVGREIGEELNLGGDHTQRITALLNDDTNPVGQVHLGVVHLFDLDSDQVTSNEDEITEVEFLTVDELKARREQLETWSQICIDGLEEMLQQP